MTLQERFAAAVIGGFVIQWFGQSSHQSNARQDICALDMQSADKIWER
jgi:hypothetical protein